MRGSPPLWGAGLPSTAGCRAPLRCGVRGSPPLQGAGLPSVEGCGGFPPLWGAGLPSVAGCVDSPPLRGAGASLHCGVRGFPPLQGAGLLSTAGCGALLCCRVWGLLSVAGCGPQRLPVGWSAGSGRVGFSSYSTRVWSGGSRAPEHRLGSCSTQVQLLGGTWDLSRSGIEPVYPARAGGFLSTPPPGTSLIVFLKYKIPAPRLEFSRHFLNFLNSDP